MAKTDKICIVCGEGFKGTAKAEVCGATCRKKLQRLKAKGEKPEFALIGGKNSKKQIQVPVKKEAPGMGVNDLTKQSAGSTMDLTKPPPKSNYSVNTRKPFMNDAIRKKLGF